MRDKNSKPFIVICYINITCYLRQTAGSITFHYYVNEFGTYLPFYNSFCTVLFNGDKYNAVTSPHSIQTKHSCLVKTKVNSKSQKQIPKKKVYLELLHQILWHGSTRSLLAGDTENVWQDIDLRVDTDPFCKSFQISTINQILNQIHILNPIHLSSGCSWTSYQPYLTKVQQNKLLFLATS